MKTRIYAPEGPVGEIGTPLAPPPASLEGQRIAVLDNGKPHAALLMGRMAACLAARTGARYLGVHRKGSAATPCESELLEELGASVDLVLTGTAD